MLNHTGTLWQYLALFVLYTSAAIGLIYLAYCYLRKSPGALFGFGKKPEAPTMQLEIESALPLDPRKSLYVVKAGNERFLIAGGGESVQLLSKLEPEAAAVPVAAPVAPVVLPMPEPVAASQPQADLPWFTQPVPVEAPPERNVPAGNRLLQSVQWLIASRIKAT